MPSFSPLLHVLVVEDESLLRWAIGETLTASGHTVVGAADGAAAMRMLTDTPHPFDVVLLSHPLPDSNDLTLLANVRRQAPMSEVVFMTADSTPDVVTGARKHGVAGVLKKPFDIHLVDRAVIDAAGV